MARDKEIGTELEAAHEALEAGRVDEARQALSRLEARAPDAAETALLRAEIARATGDAAAAREGYEHALERDPDDETRWLAHANLAELLVESNQPRDALHHARAAIELDPEQPDAYVAAARAFSRLEQLGNAMEMLDEALALDEEIPEALVLHGVLLAARGALSEALAEFSAAIDLEPETVEPYLFSARTAFELGDPLLALSTLREGRSAVPKESHPLLDLELAALQIQAGQMDGGIEMLERLVRQPDAPTRALITLGGAYAMTNQLERAIPLYEKALEREPDNPMFMGIRAEALRVLGRFDAAHAQIEALLAREVTPNALRERAAIRVGQGRVEEALKDLERAADLAPENPDMPHQLGRLLLDHDRAEEALAAFDRAVELAPGDAEPLVGRSRAHMKLNQFFLAWSDADRAVESEPDDVEALFARAESALARGHDEVALQDIDEIVAIDPEWGEMIARAARLLDRAGRPREAAELWARYVNLPAEEQAPVDLAVARRMIRQSETRKGKR